MSSVLSIIVIGLGLLIVYGIGVFAICLHAGESLLSAAIHASAWLVTFSVSQILGFLAITLR